MKSLTRPSTLKLWKERYEAGVKIEVFYEDTFYAGHNQWNLVRHWNFHEFPTIKFKFRRHVPTK